VNGGVGDYFLVLRSDIFLKITNTYTMIKPFAIDSIMSIITFTYK